MRQAQSTWRRWIAAAVLAATHLAAAPVLAQDQRVLELNREAMDDYQQLELDKAVQKLERAVELARKSNATAALGRTFMNLGVVRVAGFGDNARGLDAFVEALRIDPSQKPDPLTSTPEVMTVWNLARQRIAGEQGGGLAGNIPHVPAAGQITRTPLPVFVEVPADAPVDRVTLFYRRAGEGKFEKVRLDALEGGFGGVVPCDYVTPPSVEYFVVAYDKAGKALGHAGKEEKPAVVPVVSRLAGPAPALPGKPPPEQCVDDECPPGMPGCPTPEGEAPARGILGAVCSVDDDCASGLYCDMGSCAGEEETAGADAAPRFFAHLGGTFGAGYVTEGMPADSAPVGDGMSTTHVPASDKSCGLKNPDEYCVRIQTPGFVPTLALRLTAGYYIFERLAAALTWRFQPSAGQGTLSSMLFGLRAQYLLTDPAPRGLGLAAFVGTSYGQIQPRPEQPTSDKAPYVRTGLNGVQAGGVFVYRFTRNLGVHFTPEAHVLLPLFLFNIDLTLGLEFAF